MKHWLFLILFSSVLMADEVAPNEVFDEAALRPDPSHVVLGMGPGIILGEQKSRPGFALELSGKISPDHPLFAGLEWGSFFETNAEFTAVFAILPSISYLLNQSDSVRPMLGLAIGPLLSTGAGEDIRLLALFKPGVQFELSEAISVHFQTKFGLMGPNFVFIPTIGTAFMI